MTSDEGTARTPRAPRTTRAAAGRTGASVAGASGQATVDADTSPPGVASPWSRLTDDDLYLFNEGSHSRLYDKLGAHLTRFEGQEGACFAVWAPGADYVSVIGDFNGWDRSASALRPRGNSGIWEGFVAGVHQAHAYKYHIANPSGYQVDKADPFALHAETPPKTGSKVWDIAYEWQDAEWMRTRGERNRLDAPMNIYEMHVGSWRRQPEEGGRALSYRELAQPLADYCSDMGFTHVELLPVMEHPFGGSWGYQTTGYFAPTSRYGTPQDFKFLIDSLHAAGIGVILDWVPSHFPTDEHGPGFFDGTHLFEHADPRQGIHPDWNSFIFNYGRNEVRSFLLSSALFWLDEYHADGLRVDAVASMLYLDYSRREGEWIPNEYGGNENIEAIQFLRRFNADVYTAHPDVQTIAEESTAWPMVSRPTYVGGLGFGMKWDMGWMHDTLEYMRQDPVHRPWHHNRLTFRGLYAFTENYCLPLSHDEVVHGKGSLIAKMPGDEWQKFANLRALFGYMYTTPGKKLLFMGGEIAQGREWNHESSLDWHLLEHHLHAGVQRWVRDLSHAYRREPALHQLDCEPAGWEWVDASDWQQSVITFLRRGREPDEVALVVCNFTPVPRHNYLVGVPVSGFWREILNSDATEYGGGGVGNFGGVETVPVGIHGRPYSVNIIIPPLAVVVLRSEGGGGWTDSRVP
ncbi:MAG TPA: 1,4-alpha-glucan branching protein GlgB [Nitriliruptorales bacterium]|nr:1,4-alpha-glucan branching protein GlgB [Nitriliruptorales bacterium]